MVLLAPSFHIEVRDLRKSFFPCTTQVGLIILFVNNKIDVRKFIKGEDMTNEQLIKKLFELYQKTDSVKKNRN
jgi:hypothetical protein